MSRGSSSTSMLPIFVIVLLVIAISHSAREKREEKARQAKQPAVTAPIVEEPAKDATVPPEDEIRAAVEPESLIAENAIVVEVPLGKPLPKSLQLHVGQRLHFTITGLEEAAFSFVATGDALEVDNSPALAAKGIRVAYMVIKAGNAEITVSTATDVPGAKPREVKIPVEVTLPSP